MIRSTVYGLTALVMLLSLPTIGFGADRPPAALVPESAAVYGEINLARLASGIPHNAIPTAVEALRENLRAWPVLWHLQADNPSPSVDPKKISDFMDKARPTLAALLRAGGPRLGWAVWHNDERGGRAMAIVLQARDVNALHVAVTDALNRWGQPFTSGEPIPGAKRHLTLGDRAIIEGEDWLAYVAPKDAAHVLTEMATANGVGSLWASAAYRQACAGLPRDPMALQYVSARQFEDVSEAVKETPFPPDAVGAAPARAVAWAMALHVRKRDGKSVLAVEWEMEAGTLGYLLNLPLVLYVSPAARQREQAYAEQCRSRVEALAQAMKRYADEHGGVYPEADDWVDAILPYLQDHQALKCPLDTTSVGRTSFRMNRALSGKPLPASVDPVRAVVLYERDSDGSPSSSRHVSLCAYGFADGHAALLPPSTGPARSGDTDTAPVWTW